LNGVSHVGMFFLHVLKAVVKALFYYPTEYGFRMLVDVALASQAITFFTTHNEMLFERLGHVLPEMYKASLFSLFDFVKTHLPTNPEAAFDLKSFSVFNPVTWNISALIGLFVLLETFNNVWQYKLFTDQKTAINLSDKLSQNIQHHTYFTSLGKMLIKKKQ